MLTVLLLIRAELPQRGGGARFRSAPSARFPFRLGHRGDFPISDDGPGVNIFGTVRSLYTIYARAYSRRGPQGWVCSMPPAPPGR